MFATLLKDDSRGAPSAAEVLAQLRPLLDADSSEPDPFGTALRIVMTLVPGCTGATLSRRRSGHMHTHTVSVTGPAFEVIDRAQFRSCQGPIADVLAHRRTVVTDDVTRDPRWPDLGRRLAGGTALAAVTVPVRDESGRDNALSLYLGAPPTPADLDRLPLLVAVLEVGLVALAQLDRIRNLRHATASNRRIGMAVGVMMAYRRVTDVQAFAALAAASQALNRKVSDLAEEVILTGVLPDLLDDMPSLPEPRHATP